VVLLTTGFFLNMMLMFYVYSRSGGFMFPRFLGQFLGKLSAGLERERCLMKVDVR
jgi:hypothetical protein